MITTRPATIADAEAIASLLAELGYPTPPSDIPARITELLAHGGIVLVATSDESRVVGLATGSHQPTLHAGGSVAYITALVTAADSRGCGVGRALVDALEQWASSLGCVRISVTSAEHRADAHAFYERCGFPQTGRRFGKTLAPLRP